MKFDKINLFVRQLDRRTRLTCAGLHPYWVLVFTDLYHEFAAGICPKWLSRQD